MRDDATLVELAQSGDQAAFAELYERYFDRVYDFVARMVHDRSEAADLTQDAFIKAMNSLPGLTKGTSFKSWLLTIARNTALNRIERASRMQPLEGTNDAGEEQSYDVVDPDRFGNPEQAAEANSLAAVVWEAAAALDPKYRSILLLNLREGLDSGEIAEVMGVTKNHAYVLVNRMKAALESAVGAVALFRNGRGHCAELDAVISRLQIGEVSPEARRVIDRHAGNCPVCQEQRRNLSSPFAIIAGMALIKPAPGLKESVFGGLQQAMSALSQGGASGGAASGSSAPANGASSSTNNAAAEADTQPSGLGATSNATSGPTLVTGSSGGPPDVTPTTNDPAGDGAGKRRIAIMATAAAILLLVLLPIAAFSFFGGKDEKTELAVVKASPTASVIEPATAIATATKVAPTATKTPPPTATSTPTPDAGPPVPIEPGTGPAFEPGGGVPTTAPLTTPVPIDPGQPDPGISAPPTVTPETSGAPDPGKGPNVTPPDPGTGLDGGSVTPEPCTYSMTASPSVLVFTSRSTSQTFVIQGDACGEALRFTVQPGSNWITVSPAAGSIPPGGSVAVVVKVDLEHRTANAGRMIVSSLAGNLQIDLKIDDPTPTPTLRTPSCGVNCVTPTPTPTTSTPRGPGNFTS